MKLLIHICCAPCLIGPLERLRAEHMEVEGTFYNPNIHPFLEFRKRMKALRVFLESDDLLVEIDGTYGLEKFVTEVYAPDRHKRCENCYALRLRHTARRARDRGFDAFTTTLLVSTRQDHELIREVGDQAAAEAGTEFLYRDFRPLNDRSHEQAKRRRLYLQSYCGCCFSEYERFCSTTRELYRGGARPPKSGARKS